jgi:hypothetical protein
MATDGMRQLGRKIVRRTTDLIAVGLLLIGGLVFGRQLVEWWGDETPLSVAPQGASGASPDGGPAGWGDWESLVSWEFGDLSLGLACQTVRGDFDTVRSKLLAACLRAAETSAAPAEAASNAEKILLARTRDRAPHLKGRDGIAVYWLEDQFELAVAVRTPPDAPQEATQDATAGRVGAEPRLVCWGLALPVGEDVTTLYLFRQAEMAGSRSGVEADSVPAPPEARRILALRDERGGALSAYAGEGVPQSWMRFFDAQFASAGWSARAEWQTIHGGYRIQFERGRLEKVAAKVSDENKTSQMRTADVQITVAGDGRLQGLVYFSHQGIK